MAPLYGFVWRLLLALLQLQRTLLLWLRSRLWRRATAALLMPLALGFHDHGRPGKRPGRRAGAPDKLPAHVGLLVADEEPRYPDVAALVVWCAAAGVSYVSVYDGQGSFRRNPSRLMEQILQQQRELLGPEAPRFSVELLSGGAERQERGGEGPSCSGTGTGLSCQTAVKVLCPGDGKLGIVEAARQLCRAVERREGTPEDVDVAALDSLLRESKNVPDPDLVLKFGSVQSTVGFLPWHIRLTEIISLPSHVDVSYEDFLAALQRYAACEQRVGK
ncbi:dehydrodolichyl diphosphate synthase complex subunit nus1-like [Denticeps clupeoides]|uniref:ditrans,polycis-polyprenyl diphosphate synthase [(2E,6E)-farnesyldiphosphate specific] n=1 Tax=Denticeps clupeoides TaxID=299321 RepID=A0A8C3ZV93_9TELE|nr:dehydrodolichyl diphosphate synthase complex subunit nus1-like [Denticeps clupeoides]XP_028858206.1 dehydrodolichyl diphosphate synthase complex subunit nus1-like [Denticeps clupeoides]